MKKYAVNNWERIRFHYDVLLPEIMEAKRWEYGIDPYEWCEPRGMVNMTPIENLMWGDIRESGVVMYPQFPVLNYFLDFANPVAKIAIECDGREFHDPRKDAERDDRLEEVGWRIYRISGSDIWREGPKDEFGDSLPNKSQILCKLLAEQYQLSRRFADCEQESRIYSIAELIEPALESIKARWERAQMIRASGKYRLDE